MKRRRFWAIAVGLLLYQGACGNAFGADLTLVVPVNVSNLPPQVGSAWVSCVFKGFRWGSLEEGMEGVPQAWAPVPGIVNGTANTFVTFEVNLPERAKSIYVKYQYGCSLLFSADATHNAVYLINSPLAASKPGTTPIIHVTGTFP